MSTNAHEHAYAKLTRYLHVVGQRDDGMHLIDSEMVTVDFADELEISPGDHLEVVDAVSWANRAVAHSPLAVPDGTDNLVLRALRIAQRSAAVRLIKHIPPGAGLGGGSADAAAIFRWAGVNDLEGAARLGADIPFCVHGGRARVSGIGEVIEPLEFAPMTFVLVTPDLLVPTAAVYGAYDALPKATQRTGDNHLAPAALAVCPELTWWRDLITETIGREPTLAGSGSTWFLEVSADGRTEQTDLAAAVIASGRQACVTLCHAVDPSR